MFEDLFYPVLVLFGWTLSSALARSLLFEQILALCRVFLHLEQVPFFCLMVVALMAKIVSPALNQIVVHQHLSESLLFLISGILTAHCLKMNLELFALVSLVNMVSLMLFFIFSIFKVKNTRILCRHTSNGAVIAMLSSGFGVLETYNLLGLLLINLVLNLKQLFFDTWMGMKQLV